jgi:ribosomal protein S18 acetylase RimI-like enzyme
MDPVVRVAVATDHDELARLQALARDSLIDVRGGALRLAECPIVEDWASIIDADDGCVFVATIGDILVGYLVLRLAPERKRGVITHAFVEEGARELGFGDTMVELAIEAVRAAGLPGIEATALPGDRETKNLYERAGLTARKITVYKSLG